MEILVQLFWSFLKIGFTSFGGLSMIPLISSEVISHGWMDESAVSDIVAIAEMTPGPLGLNSATFAGIKTFGILGAIVANLGVLMPTFTICLIAAICFEKFKESKRMEQIMSGVRPVCIGLIFGIIGNLALSNYFKQSKVVNPPALVIGIIDLVLILKWKVSVPKILLLSAILGILLIH